ncbi:WecB/TagA/CpsF family glycosyltransferase [Acaryochloris sp. IP29b_bin.148]|uniref:WecB/TagA/CpsF family glycosyltransferase n=1 Tax=Acaryochloris sp. IP29b_bin.148 TaxID=2969218 RepID=UPI002603F144|nr:WecB/TagA/CpsF family glycosyltransferase [Acaryochloris sp. IP29b_bin.148]
MKLVQKSLTSEQPESLPILGLSVDILPNYVQWLMTQIDQGQGLHVVTLNAEMTMQARSNPALAQVIQNANLVIPDGAGVVMHFRLRGRKIDRCPGIEMAAALLQAAVSSQYSFFFYGGEPGVTELAAQKWRQQLPQINIIGTQHGYVAGEEMDQFCQTLQQLQPQVIFVGLGVPRQEFWIAEHRHLCPNSVWIGVGGSFDIWAETKTRAPGWLCDNNLEWVYRLYQEPWRWRRMLALPQFAWRSLMDIFS